MANFSFDARSVAPDEGRVGAVPAGWYPVSVDQTEMKPTADTLGTYLNARFKVLDGPHKGVSVYHRFNTKNNSEKAVEIGYKQLSALMHAIKVLTIDTTERLHNIPLFVKLKLVPAEGQYEAKNEITAFREITDAAARAGFAAQTGAPGAAAPAKITPPPVAGQAAPAAAPAAQAGGWQPPANQQPWGGTQAPAGAASTGNGQFVQPAPTATAPATSTANPTSAPAAAPAATPAPAWQQPAQNTTPVQQAPVQQAPVQEQAPVQQAPAQQAPAAQPQAGEILPPWMQPQQ